MAFRWRADDGPTLNAGLVADFSGDLDSVSKKPYIFVIFQRGSGPMPPHPPPAPSGSEHAT